MKIEIQVRLNGIDCYTYRSFYLDVDCDEASEIERLPKKIKWESFINNISANLSKRFEKQLEKELIEGKPPQYLKNFYSHQFKPVGVTIKLIE